MDIGSVLACTPHIVESMFQHLTFKDLLSCSYVCSLWATLSQEEMRRRKGIVSFCQEAKCWERFEHDKTHKGCDLMQVKKFESKLKKQLRNVNFKPAFCIAFATSAFLENFERIFPSYFDGTQSRKRRKRCHWDYFDAAIEIALRKHLPSNCCISLYLQTNITFYGGHSKSHTVTTNSPAICGYLFSNLPDGELNFYKRKESVGPILEHINKNGHNIKCTLNIVDYTSMSNFQIALKELRHRHDAVKSGVIMPVWLGSNYVPVFEGPNVQVFRYDIQANDGHYHTKMKHFQNEMDIKEESTDYTIAFLFSLYYRECIKVCQSFEFYFPSVPLIGMFQNFENMPMKFGLKNEQAYPESLFKNGVSCQSVFIFVTFKNFVETGDN